MNCDMDDSGRNSKLMNDAFASAEERRQFTAAPQQRGLARLQIPPHGSLNKVSRDTRSCSPTARRLLMSTVIRPHVRIANERGRSSFQSNMSGALCSRGTVPSVEVRLVRTSAAKPAEFEGESRSLTTLSPFTHTHQLCSVVHITCAPAPTVIM